MNDMSGAQRDKLVRIFHQFDSNGNGSITLKEFRLACRRFTADISFSEIDHLAHEVQTVHSYHVTSSISEQRFSFPLYVYNRFYLTNVLNNIVPVIPHYITILLIWYLQYIHYTCTRHWIKPPSGFTVELRSLLQCPCDMIFKYYNKYGE